LKSIPKEAVRTVFVLSRLAYCGFFDWYISREETTIFGKTKRWKDPKIIYTKEDLTQCNIEVSPDWDGYGLLKATPTHSVPVDNLTYNFAHLTIQEFLCAVYMSMLSSEEQQRIMSEHFDDYPNVFVYLCGLTKIVCAATSQFVFEKLKSSNRTGVTALRCLYESTKTDPPQSATPFEMNLTGTILQPYDCLCVGYVLSYYPVTKVNIRLCHIGDNGAEMLAKNFYALQELNLFGNSLAVTGVRHMVKIVMKS